MSCFVVNGAIMIGKKGYYGYIKRGRKVFAFVTFGLLAAVLGMYFGALR